jgi:hypothetical protein
MMTSQPHHDSLEARDAKVAALVKTHLHRYKEFDVMDVYRLLHQAAFGVGHLIRAEKAEREWLERQSETTPPDAGPLLENIHPDGQWVRLHLRPYLAAKGDLKRLLNAYVASAKATPSTAAVMEAYWAAFKRLVQVDGELSSRFEARRVELFGRTSAASNWPAGQHSPAVIHHYHPVYRVLSLPLAQDLLTKQRMSDKVI